MVKEKRTHKSAFGGKSYFSDRQHEEARQGLDRMFEELKAKVPTVEKEFIGNGYFIFEQHILYFRDSRIPDWQFALWATYDDNRDINGCKYIGDQDRLVDKFKPSYTWVSVSSMEDFIEKLNLIIEKPYDCYAASKYFMTIEEFREKQTDTDPKKEYENDVNRDKAKEKLLKESNEAAIKTYPKRIMELVPYLSGVGLVDQNVGGWDCSPRYELSVSVSPSEFRKNQDLTWSKIHDDVNDALENINKNEMAKYMDEESGFYYSVMANIIQYYFLGWKTAFLTYTELFKRCHYVSYRMRLDGSYLDAVYIGRKEDENA